MVKIARKMKVNEMERTSFFSDGTFLVTDIATDFGQKYYTVLDKQYTRGDLLKV